MSVLKSSTFNLTFTLVGVIVANGIFPVRVVPQEISLDTLCHKFPQNSRCQAKNYSPDTSNLNTSRHQFKRDRFCQKFPLNSHCQQAPVKVIKLNLADSGEDNEWIRLEKKGNTVRFVHTNQVEQSLVSDVIDGVMDLVDLSVPILFNTSVYTWEDHQITKVIFKSDRCQSRQKNCLVEGKETLKLPPGSSIHQGLFTIHYQENDLRRSLSFRIPADAETEINDTVTVTVTDQTSQ